MIPRKRLNRRKLSGYRIRQFITPRWNENRRGVDTAPSSIGRNGFHESLGMTFPFPEIIVSNQDFAPPRAMNLNARKARIFSDRGVTSKRNSPTTRHKNGIPALMGSRIKAEGFFREPRGNQGLHSSQGGNWIFPTRRQQDRNLQHRSG